MKEEEISVAAVQETKFSSSNSMSGIGDFVVVRKNRARKEGGGLAFVMNNIVQYTFIPSVEMSI